MPTPERESADRRMPATQGTLFGGEPGHAAAAGDLAADLAVFDAFGRRSERTETAPQDGGEGVTTFVNEFWTARQRAADPLHEVSYRACFKPALPRFFIERLTRPGDVVYDPFAGRGTTPLEAALLGRVPWARDVNPLARVLLEPRLDPPKVEEVDDWLRRFDFAAAPEPDPEDELLTFFHPRTLRAIHSLRAHFLARGDGCDRIERFVRMVAVNRLTGHSPGFFSVYTLPPNQATTVAGQRRINERRNQSPPFRDVSERIGKKARALLARCDDAVRARLAAVWSDARITTGRADDRSELPPGRVALVVTSPPFLDVVQYRADNWLRCWFCGIDPDRVAISHLGKVEDWRSAMTSALAELRRLLRPGGRVAFEVGEVRGGTIRLEEVVVSAGRDAGLEAELVMIHAQEFTKTANCWGVANNRRGTNSNRIVVFRRAEH